MQQPFGPEQRRDFAGRGFSRRDLGRLAAFLAAGSALPFYNEAAMAQGLSMPCPNLPPDAVRINANENPMGPCPEADRGDPAAWSPRAGRYLYGETTELQSETLAEVEGLSVEDHVLPGAGSSDLLHRAVLAFTVAEQEPGDRRSRLRGRRESRAFHRGQGRQRPACARTDRTTPSAMVQASTLRRRFDLRLQPQQSDRLGDP